MDSTRSISRHAALASAVAAALLPGIAASQEALDEVVVTARRKAESLQDAPVSVTAISGDQIAAQGLEDLRDIARVTTGLRFDDLIGGLFSSPVIRGLAQTNTFGENNVGTFIDGIYISSKAGLNVSLLDIDRVEVIKGPQSALYGRNTFAGAINYVTRRPGDAFDGNARVSGGEDGLREVQASLGGPLSPGGVLKGRLSAAYNEYDGGYREAATGDKLGGYEKKGANVNLLLTPSEAFQADLGVYYAEDEYRGLVIARPANNCARNPATGVFQDYCGALPDLDEIPTGQSTRNPLLQPHDRTVLLGRLSLRFTFAGGYELESLTGYNDVDSESYGDFDRFQSGEPFALVGGGTTLVNVWLGENNAGKDKSQELRLSSPADRRFRWSVGAFWFETENERGVPSAIDLSTVPAGRRLASPFATLIGSPDGRTVPTFSLNVDTGEQWSGFASLEGDVTDRITLIGEVRYTDEKKSTDVIRNAFIGGRDPDGAGNRGEWNWVDTRLVARFRATQDVMIYGSAAKGTKAGGFNGNAIVAEDVRYDPEQNWTYELGTKTTWMDGRLVVNGALFFVDWQDVQLQAPNSSPLSPVNVIKNFGKAEAYGAELEIAARVADGVDVGIGAAYTNPEFVDSYTTADAALCALIAGCRTEVRNFSGANRLVAVLDGNNLPRAFQEQFYANVALEQPLAGAWNWFARADWSYNGKEYDRAINQAWIPSRQIVDVRAGVRNDAWTFTVFADNVLDDATATASSRQASLATNINTSDTIGGQRRRLVGASVEYRFQ